MVYGGPIRVCSSPLLLLLLLFLQHELPSELFVKLFLTLLMMTLDRGQSDGYGTKTHHDGSFRLSRLFTAIIRIAHNQQCVYCSVLIPINGFEHRLAIMCRQSDSDNLTKCKHEQNEIVVVRKHATECDNPRVNRSIALCGFFCRRPC